MALRSPVWLLPPFQSSALPMSRGGNRLAAWRRILPRVFRTADSWKKLPRGPVPSNAQVASLVPSRPLGRCTDSTIETKAVSTAHFYQGKPPPKCTGIDGKPLKRLPRPFCGAAAASQGGVNKGGVADE